MDALPGIDLSQAMSLWSLSKNAKATLINVSENRTYLITDVDRARMVLREHRPNYHSRQAIESELMWLQALHFGCDVSVPIVVPGDDSAAIQTVNHPGDSTPRHLVMFEFMEGSEPVDDIGMLEHFCTLGSTAARMHLHSMQWQQPVEFVRRQWNIDTVLGEQAAWGHWSGGPGMDNTIKPVLASLEAVLCKRLASMGMVSDVYGLIHADMRRANLLLDGDVTHVIDFDDCGFSWFLYDFATAVSFMEDHPQMAQLKESWLQGYQQHRPLSAEQIHEIDTLVMFRRLALLGWMGTHDDVEIVKALSSTFAQGSAQLAERYLGVFG